MFSRLPPILDFLFFRSFMQNTAAPAGLLLFDHPVVSPFSSWIGAQPPLLSFAACALQQLRTCRKKRNTVAKLLRFKSTDIGIGLFDSDIIRVSESISTSFS
jgi:hypothetical protein